MMYKIEDRGNITRYYNAEKRNAVEKLKGDDWKLYRKMWDASITEYESIPTPPPFIRGKLRTHFLV